MVVAASRSAADAQQDATQKMARRLRKSTKEVEGFATEYTDFLTDLDTNFDPFNVEEAFNSLYESVIQPMERDFDENVLPGIQAAYSGGIGGDFGGGVSGAQMETESKARRGLSETTAQLRSGERDKAINRNYMEYDRRAGLGAKKFEAQTAAPLLRADQASQIYGAQSDSIAATLASRQAAIAIPGQAASGAITGMDLLSKYRNQTNPNTPVG